jgi:hypothetical protein
MPKKVAAVVTEYRKWSHADVILRNLLDGYPDGKRPGMELVALYNDQVPKTDMSRDLAKKHGFTIYKTIGDCLTLGGQTLAVEGVLSIGEHGNYPENEKGQRLYPRRRFFEEITKVFEKSGKSVPVFNDKHLAPTWADAKWMYDRARKLMFPFLAGSSIPVTWRKPDLTLPKGCELTGAVQIGYGPFEGYGFHAIEGLQCMVERRKGGETGVAAVEARRGQAVWKALAAADWSQGGCSRELFETCLCRSFTLASPRPGYGNAFPELKDLPALVRDPVMYRIEYTDGLKGTLLMLSGLVRDFTVALRVKDQQAPLSTQMYLPGLHPGQTLPNFFSALAQQIETMFLTGKPPYPVERTLLTTGILAAAIDSLGQGQKRLDTPHLRQVAYQSPRESTFMRS